MRLPLKRLLQPYRAGLASWRLAMRLIVAGILSVSLVQLLGLPQGFWAVITAIIVIQSNVGGSLRMARDRLVGTFFGALIGLLAVTAMPDGSLGRGVGLLIALVPTAIASAASPAFRMAPITAILLLMSVHTSVTPLALGLDRVLEIALGGAIGLGVSLTVLPATAHRDLRRILNRALLLMAGAFEPMLAGLSGQRDDARLRGLHQDIRRMLTRADQTAEEARQERAARLTDERDPDVLVNTVRRLHTNLLLLGRATMQPLPDVVGAILIPPLASAGAGVKADFQAVAKSLVDGSLPPDLSGVDEALRLIDQSLGRLRAEGLTRELPIETIQRLYAVAFAFAQFRRDLIELHASVSGQAGDIGSS